MRRFFLAPSACHGPELRLTGAEARHAARVLRIERGERAVVLDGAGHEFLCQAAEIQRDQIALRVIQKNDLPPLPHQITLIQAIAKSKAMDLIVQKAAELGARRIIPILAERSVVQLDGDAGQKLEKWRATAVEAIKQCGSAWLPEIDPPLSPQAFLANDERFDLALLATLQSGARHPREYLENFRAERKNRAIHVAVWVGPEGDFTPAEINAIRGHGALPITLGQLVLRSETAAIYCLAVLNYELQSP